MNEEIKLTIEEQNKFLKILANCMLPKDSVGEPLNAGIKYAMDKITAMDVNEKIKNPATEYAAKFANNHRISISEALNEPMVQARFNVFNKLGI